uniref:Large ribosomal subunit protein uL4c n=1 Tax=Porolithon onkodes TaxID=231751 RepID=A0A2Z2KVG0_9FLOR|nr:50S ribosomal protein L4 [Porolithon onkodes]ASB29717.1 50S ribosomal protein L4 [Porolithon onkodes]
MANQIEYKIKSFSKDTKTLKLSVSNSNTMHSIHKLATKQLHEKRQGNANSKTRSEVRGGGKKPWKQKGTGRARAGSTRSPLWRGGGVIFGPKTKEYSKKVNKKEKHLALCNLLYNRKDFTISFNSSVFTLQQPKTKFFLKKLQDLNVDLTTKILIIVTKKNLHIQRVTKNIQNIELICVNQLNIIAIIKAKQILIENDAIDIINHLSNE